MNLEVIRKYDDLIILMRQDPEDGFYDYYVSNPWYTIIHHWTGASEKMNMKEITKCYKRGEFEDFISRYCF